MVKELDTSFGTFWDFMKQSRILKAGLAFNLLYYLCVILAFVFYYLQGTLSETIYTLDFQVFYEAGQVFPNSPSEIYSVNPNGLPYRYLPSFAAFIAPFTNIPLIILYFINISFMMILNVGIVFFVYLVSVQRGVKASTKNFEKTLLIVFITPQHIVNIILGQITQIAILLVLIALFILQSNSNDSFQWFICVGLLIGVASTLKPFFLILIPFLIPITLRSRFRIDVEFRQVAGVISGFMLSMLPNIVFFVIYPATIEQFLQVNIEGLSNHHSTSITRLLSTLLTGVGVYGIELAIMLVLGCCLFMISYVRFVKASDKQKNYIHHFSEMMFLVLLVYPDSWFLFLGVWYAFLAPSMIYLYSYQNLSEKEMHTLDILWSGSNNLLAFFSFGIVVHYLVLGIDPINPIWLLILYLLYHRLLVKRNEEIESSESELSLRV
jgi:hypothetical protein